MWFLDGMLTNVMNRVYLVGEGERDRNNKTNIIHMKYDNVDPKKGYSLVMKIYR